MFLENQPEKAKQKYLDTLNLLGRFSKLFSNSESPFLQYRVAERVFCDRLESEDLSRSDVSYDAKKNSTGIGIKTFLHNNGHTLQKVAEFNGSSDILRAISEPLELIHKVSEYRNLRIKSTNQIYNLDNGIYHCVTRSRNKINIYECPLSEINIDSVSLEVNPSNSLNTLFFNDGNFNYKFDKSKSTLYKRFDFRGPPLEEVNIEILDDPIKLLESLLNEDLNLSKAENTSIILPLYSEKSGNVEPESGLNQAMAGGRARDDREVYIPIPSWIHYVFPNFLPDQDRMFSLELPNGTILEASTCQNLRNAFTQKTGRKLGKALMSKPNKALGNWLLDDVLRVPKGDACTNKHLKAVGIDSIFLEKVSGNYFKIDFRPLGSFEEFAVKAKDGLTERNIYNSFLEQNL